MRYDGLTSSLKILSQDGGGFFLSYFSYFCVLFSTTKILKSLLDGPVLSDGQIIGRASIYGVCTDERHPMNNSRVSLVV